VSPWLAAAYAALALGLAWSLTGSAAWRRRLPYVVCAPPLALALWLGRSDPAGWPSTAKVPAHAQLVWAVVDEPEPALSDPGHVYLWLDVGRAAPRAYVLPYTRQLHTQVQGALNAIKHGRSMGVGRPVTTAARRAKSMPGQRESPVRFYPHPAVLLPPKTH
jgi:hypothetical protein